MIHQPIELDRGRPGWSGRVALLLCGAVLSTAALLAWAMGAALAAAVVAGLAVPPLIAALLRMGRAARPGLAGPAVDGSADTVPLVDRGLVGAVLAAIDQAAAMTDSRGELVVANPGYTERFGGSSPLRIGNDPDSARTLDQAIVAALRSGSAAATVATRAGTLAITVERAGSSGGMLLWRLQQPPRPDPLTIAAERVGGALGAKLAAVGVLAAVVDRQGRLVAANRPFAERAIGHDAEAGELAFARLVQPDNQGKLSLVAEGEAAHSLQVVHLPLDGETEEARAGTFLLFDSGHGGASAANLQSLLEILPIGLALVDRDGRFITMNKAFRTAGGVGRDEAPVYPGDLVVKEDKAAVADAVHRSARGPAMSGDIAVRLRHQPGEPVALTIAGLRGLGDSSVLLLLKDNSEEAKLKRQVAQATKMQAIGQLAGGVAHDFNNILTAIIGHCDLMLMRHTPGDSDYDDIQQIRGNSNRAAGLTRQLLAFSRQQTLRPQVLQLPDVVSEVSHLLKRLLGETVQLIVKHGRDLGAVRADPGQLEQVIVNLAVNARDAMAAKGGGTLTIQTYSVRADQVAGLGSEILPVADYSALSVADTGTGIPPNVLGKIFEPFFTTKEVGKGTGLGLSTVYGIVKQSGGFIFANSRVGEGTTFVIYLPVHREERRAPPARSAAKPESAGDLWGSGTVLLVEDEPMVRAVAERALTRQGYSVITANNGEEALEVIGRGEPIALLISDVVMPAMDGPTMVREARRSRPELPVLFMSGYAEEQLRNAIDLDNMAFLPKPFSVQELAEAARRALGK